MPNIEKQIQYIQHSLEYLYNLQTTGGGNTTNLQTTVTTIETGAGLSNTGTYVADNTTNYLTSASSLKNADKILDTQIKSNSDAITALHTIILIPTEVKTANYLAIANDFVKTDATSGSIVITLPTAPIDKTRLGIKMIAVSGSFNTSIIVGGTDVFNKTGGTTTVVLSLLNQSIVVQYESATHIWNIVNSDLPLSALDLRFLSSTAPVLPNINTNTTNGEIGYDQTNTALTIGNGTNINQINMGAWKDFIPTITGFSTTPPILAARYCLIGKSCTFHLRSTVGVSNATTFTITLPFAAANTGLQIFLVWGQDNGVNLTSPSGLFTRLNSNIADVYKTMVTGSVWTASGNKNANFVITYETV